MTYEIWDTASGNLLFHGNEGQVYSFVRQRVVGLGLSEFHGLALLATNSDGTQHKIAEDEAVVAWTNSLAAHVTGPSFFRRR